MSLCRIVNVQVTLGIFLTSSEISKADGGILSYGDSCLGFLYMRLRGI